MAVAELSSLQEPPEGHREASRRPPGGPQEASRKPFEPSFRQEARGDLQEAHKKPPKKPLGSPQGAAKDPHEAPRGGTQDKAQRLPEEAKRPLREAQRGAHREYNKKRDIDDLLKGNRGFSVDRVSSNGTKFDQKRAKKEQRRKQRIADRSKSAFRDEAGATRNLPRRAKRTVPPFDPVVVGVFRGPLPPPRSSIEEGSTKNEVRRTK